MAIGGELVYVARLRSGGKAFASAEVNLLCGGLLQRCRNRGDVVHEHIGELCPSMRMIELTEQQRVHNADNDDIHGSGGGTRRPTTRRRWSRIIWAISAWKDLMATRRMRPRRMLCWTMRIGLKSFSCQRGQRLHRMRESTLARKRRPQRLSCSAFLPTFLRGLKPSPALPVVQSDLYTEAS